MKYLFIIANKAAFAVLLAFLLAKPAFSQKTTDSPYSRYGVGLLNPKSFNGNFGMAGVGIAWRPYQYKPQIYDSLARSNAALNDRGSNFINPGNPASFSNISLTTFEAALLSRNTQYQSGNQERIGSNTQFSYMAVAFPLGQKWGAGFGIRPFSRVGYDYKVIGEVNGNELTYIYEGSGGLNEIFMSTGVEIGRFLSIGISGKYLFGSILDDRRVVYGGNSANFFNSYDQKDLKINDLTFDFGVQYYRDFKKKYRLIAGATASPIDQLDAEQSQLIRNYTGRTEIESFKDTAFFQENSSTTVPFAPQYGLGFAFEKKKNWIVVLDYQLIARDRMDVGDNVQLTPSNIYKIGFERYNNLSSFGSYWKQMGYKAGARYNTSLLNVDGTDVQEFGISFGISMPLRKSFSTLNLGFEVGRRGENNKSLTLENFFNFQFGVTINDKWFIKRKYD